MRFDTSQQMKLGQQMKLAPRMIQSMEILQMPMLALQERIEQELASNATLETFEPGRTAEIDEIRRESERDATEHERELKVDDGGNAADFERLDSMEGPIPRRPRTSTTPPTLPSPSRVGLRRRATRDTGERDGKMDAMATAAGRQRRRAVARAVVARAIDDRTRALGARGRVRGRRRHIRTPLEQIADQAGDPDRR